MTEPEHEAPPPVSIGDAAHRLGVSVDTVRRWGKQGKIHSIRTPGGQRRFALSEVERILSGTKEEAS